MKAITTKYIPPTNTRGARIKATDGHNSVTVPYDHGMDDLERDQQAAVALISKMVNAGYWRKPTAIVSAGLNDKGDVVHIMLHGKVKGDGEITLIR